MRIGAVIHPTAVSESDRWPRLKRFSRHVIEMTLAMMLGMCVLGMAFRAIHVALFGTGFDAAWHEHTELAVFAMTFNMTLPMVALMRYRGHPWQRCGEMAAAMLVLAFVLLVAFWLGALSAEAVLPLEMALMLPAMIAVMAVRFDEYARPHGSASASAGRTA
jgi:peptidoglycan/LPS O-acetylase OafA/YrhL